MYQDPHQHIRPLAHAFSLYVPHARVGVLLVHGFAGTPYHMRDLAHFLHENGYTVSVVRLPGHGSRVEHLARVRLSDWMQSLRRSLDALRARVDYVVVVGRSFGGVLTLLELSQRPQSADAIVLISTPSTIHAAWWIRRILPILRLMRPYVKKPWLEAHENIERMEVGSYSALPLNALREFLHGLNILRHTDLGRITHPALIVHSQDDPLALPKSAQFFMTKLGSSTKEILWLQRLEHHADKMHQHPALQERLLSFLANVTKPAS